MVDEIRLQNLGEGRLSETLENKNAILVGKYFSSKEKPLCVDHLEELKSLGDTYGIDFGF